MSPAARMEITEAMTAVSIWTAPSQRKAAETAPATPVPAAAAEVRPPHPEAAAAVISPETAIPVQTQAMDPPTEAILTYVRMNLRNRQ